MGHEALTCPLLGLESLTKLFYKPRADDGASKCEQRDMSIGTQFETDT